MTLEDAIYSLDKAFNNRMIYVIFYDDGSGKVCKTITSASHERIKDFLFEFARIDEFIKEVENRLGNT